MKEHEKPTWANAKKTASVHVTHKLVDPNKYDLEKTVEKDAGIAHKTVGTHPKEPEYQYKYKDNYKYGWKGLHPQEAESLKQKLAEKKRDVEIQYHKKSHGMSTKNQRETARKLGVHFGSPGDIEGWPISAKIPDPDKR